MFEVEKWKAGFFLLHTKPLSFFFFLDTNGPLLQHFVLIKASCSCQNNKLLCLAGHRMHNLCCANDASCVQLYAKLPLHFAHPNAGILVL